MISALLLTLTLSALAEGAPPPGAPRFASLALIVASNRGAQASRPPLLYADDDGAKYQRVFSTLAGEENTFLLTDFDRDTARLFPDLVTRVRSPTRVQLESAIGQVAARAQGLKREGTPVRFYFVFAGHGDVDGGRGFLELADGPFTADDLQAMLRAVEATEAHVILDSCNSFFVVNPRKPGGTRFPTTKETAESLAQRLPNVGVFLSTAAQAEVFEWSELQSGVFSHAVRSGLMGAADADSDGTVSYQELAAFVDTAAAEIKNPLFRPKVFARGPNGEPGRAILDVPQSGRTAVTVDDVAAVRLAVRDADGLRWLDAYKEKGTELRLWLPLTLGPRPELERLSTGTSGQPDVEASFAVPAGAATAIRLADLEPVRPTLANRGAGEIFQGLFRRPFGPIALAAYVSREAAPDAPATLSLPIDPAPAAAQRTVEQPAVYPAGAGATYVTLRAGALLPVSGSSFIPAARGSATLGFTIHRYFAVEAEAGYSAAARDPQRFSVPGETYINRQPPAAVLAYRAFPVGLALSLRAATGTIRPYVLAGAGLVFANVEADPMDFNPTLRANRILPELHGGAGFTVDVGRRFFAGAEARYVWVERASAFGVGFDLSGVGIGALAGFRFAGTAR